MDYFVFASMTVTMQMKRPNAVIFKHLEKTFDFDFKIKYYMTKVSICRTYSIS